MIGKIQFQFLVGDAVNTVVTSPCNYIWSLTHLRNSELETKLEINPDFDNFIRNNMIWYDIKGSLMTVNFMLVILSDQHVNRHFAGLYNFF